MIGVVGAVVIVAASAVVAGGAMVAASAISASAQRDVAETNAKATVEAAHAAANAQVESSKQEAMAQMHESDIDLKRDQAFIEEEKWYANQKSDEFSNYQQEIGKVDSIDTIDITYSDQGSFGTGSGGAYDYGHH